VRYWDGTSYGTTCYDDLVHRLPLQEITLEVRNPRGDVVRTLALVKGAG
jgi:hypothetical protein